MKQFLVCIFILILQSAVEAQQMQDVAKNAVQLTSQQEIFFSDTVALSTPLTSDKRSNKPATAGNNKKIASLSERFDVFSGLSENEVYSITIAADVPDNNNPRRVYVKKQPGHVFVIVEQKDTINRKAVAQVWGFYPIRPVSSLFFKNVRCELIDNGRRKYDAAITRQLTENEFKLVKAKAIELAGKKYNINKYNCYDYAIELFNAIPGIEKLPVTHVKFPFIFGRGGSPCGLYRDLEKLKTNNTVWTSSIQIGSFKAPASYQVPTRAITPFDQ